MSESRERPTASAPARPASGGRHTAAGVARTRAAASSAAAKPGASRTTAKPAASRTAAKPGASRPAAKPGASRPAAKQGASRTAARPGANRTTARPGVKRPAAPGGRRPGKRRGGLRLDLRDVRLWLIVAAVVIVIAVIVALALPKPSGGKQDAPAQADGTESATAAPEATQEAEEAAAPAEAGDAAATGDSATGDAATGETAQLDPKVAELVAKYHITDDLTTTEQPLGVQECPRVEDSYFDDVLFVGDSVTKKLQEYVVYARKHGEPDLLGKASFLAAQSFSARNALMIVSEKSIHPVIGGEKMTLEDAIAKLAPKKLYIMLGVNDVGISGLDGALQNMGKLLMRIQEKNPGLKIFVESATPRYKGTHPSTQQLFAFDVMLYDAILGLNDPNIRFVDVGYTMRDAEGKLPKEYCYDPDDMGIHFTNEGCRHWIDYLYTHAEV